MPIHIWSQRYKLSRSIFDLLGYILQERCKKVTKTSISKAQTHDVCSVGWQETPYFTPIYRGEIIFEYYVFAGTLRYQINTQITQDSYISD